MGADGKKMSKSLGNLVSSSEIVDRAGADACRMTINFISPFEFNRNWSDETLVGVERFLKRVENMSDNLSSDAPNGEQEFLINDLIQKMTQRFENMQFNTAISAMMEYLNAFAGAPTPRACYEILLQCLNPFAPHLTEEMWEKIGHKDMLVFEPWPTFDEAKLARSNMTIAVSVNGKRRAEITVGVNESKDQIESLARASAEKYITGDIKKTIFIPGKMVNFVV